MHTNPFSARNVFHVKQWAAVLLIALMAASAAGCALSRNPITGNKRAYGYSWDQERQMGQEADQQIVQQFGVYENDELQRYVDRVAQEVLAESHMRRPETDQVFRETPFVFRVLDSEIINAFALPGGYVYVTRGLLTHLENEAQLAVVLGHEIGHVAARHASERAFEQQLGQIAVLGGAVLGQQVLGLPAQDLLNLGGTAAQLLFLSYSREDERESDELGVEYAALAGYQAAEGSEFFNVLERMQEKSGQSIPGFMSTHPDPGNRKRRIVELASEWSGTTPMSQVGQEAYLDAIDGVIVGANPRNGYEADNTFYHPDLRFRFAVPRGFQLVNQATQVIMVDQNQRAVIGFQIAQAQSAQAGATEFARQEGLQVVDSGRTSTNELPAYYVLADAQTQDGQVIRALAYFIEYDRNVYSFIGYTTRDAFSQYEDAFLTAMRGFGPLRDPSILNIQPARIDVVPAPRTAPFRTFVPDRLPRDLSPEDVAIMNQVQLDETVQQGTLLKLVRW